MYTSESRIAASQVGINGKQTLVSVVRTMQDCSQLWLESEPAMQAWLEEDAITMMVASRQVDVLRYLEYGEAATESHPVGWLDVRQSHNG